MTYDTICYLWSIWSERIPSLLTRLYRCDWSRWRSSIVPAGHVIPICILSIQWTAYSWLISVIDCLLLFLILFHKHEYFLCLMVSHFFISNKFLNKQIFSCQNSLLFNRIIEFSVFCIENFFLIVIFFIIFIFIVSIVFAFICIYALGSIFVFNVISIIVTVKLFQNILNLSFKLFITLFH